MHVAQIGLLNDPGRRPPAELLRAWPTLVDVAEAAACAGMTVTVLQAAEERARLQADGVVYEFLPVGPDPVQGLRALIDCLASLGPQVMHVHGLEFSRQVQTLAAACPGRPIVLQDHASRPPALWRRRAWRAGITAAAGIAFCAREQSRPFERAGLFGPGTRIYEIPESTSRFQPGDRAEARRETGLTGAPAVLWVGHLDANKDPLCVLEGISRAVRELSELELWCCFGTAPLLDAVQARIGRDARLRGRVHLLGALPHGRIEQVMRAADLFVSASHREGSGYALIEALACGLPPVVSDIPSFRTLTADGTVGHLWRTGDPDALSQALRRATEVLGPPRRAMVRAHFDRELSFAALGGKLAAMYADVLSCARGPSIASAGAP